MQKFGVFCGFGTCGFAYFGVRLWVLVYTVWFGADYCCGLLGLRFWVLAIILGFVCAVCVVLLSG